LDAGETLVPESLGDGLLVDAGADPDGTALTTMIPSAM
jgi:hypothetical protein